MASIALGGKRIALPHDEVVADHTDYLFGKVDGPYWLRVAFQPMSSPRPRDALLLEGAKVAERLVTLYGALARFGEMGFRRLPAWNGVDVDSYAVHANVSVAKEPKELAVHSALVFAVGRLVVTLAAHKRRGKTKDEDLRETLRLIARHTSPGELNAGDDARPVVAPPPGYAWQQGGPLTFPVPATLAPPPARTVRLASGLVANFREEPPGGADTIADAVVPDGLPELRAKPIRFTVQTAPPYVTATRPPPGVDALVADAAPAPARVGPVTLEVFGAPDAAADFARRVRRANGEAAQ